ncbi:phosphoribosyl-AMP cyclohydrolase [Halocynthiibacter sp.]|uniref:phosphoribosyl-AMP cyclohydrolase n=1 Tax=Halocynthiibacter sp. TaxID=1979210 RepID=UPI003C5E39EC
MKFDVKKLRFNDQGLLPVIAQDHNSLEVLMLAWMNAEAVQRTVDSGKVTYWSRSRQSFWVKGESSGNTQNLVDLRFDCDQDCILVLVEQNGPACHTNRRSCFYTAVREGDEIELMQPE